MFGAHFKEMNRISLYHIGLLLVQWLMCDMFQVDECYVKWKIAKTTAIFGENVQLTCYFHNKDNCLEEQLRKWIGGPQNELLMLESAPSNELKYISELHEANSFSLIIKNFSAEDINLSYTCCYGFRCCVKVLDLNESNFEKYPTIKEKLVNAAFINGTAKVSIYIKDVYPLPTCIAKMNEKSVTIRVHTHVRNLFYSANISIQAEIPECHPSTLIVVCRFGSRRIEVYRKQRLKYRHCEDSKKDSNNEDSKKDSNNEDSKKESNNEDSKKDSNNDILYQATLPPSSVAVICLVILIVFGIKKTKGRTKLCLQRVFSRRNTNGIKRISQL